jgi:hypothetical protein
MEFWVVIMNLFIMIMNLFIMNGVYTFSSIMVVMHVNVYT